MAIAGTVHVVLPKCSTTLRCWGYVVPKHLNMVVRRSFSGASIRLSTTRILFQILGYAERRRFQVKTLRYSPCRVDPAKSCLFECLFQLILFCLGDTFSRFIVEERQRQAHCSRVTCCCVWRMYLMLSRCAVIVSSCAMKIVFRGFLRYFSSRRHAVAPSALHHGEHFYCP